MGNIDSHRTSNFSKISIWFQIIGGVYIGHSDQIRSDQSLSCVRLFATP